MSQHDQPDPADAKVFEADLEATYTIEVIARLAGVDSEMILHYREHGLIVPVQAETPERFDNEALRLLRRLEHLRTSHELSLPALKLVRGLMAELEQAREQLRHRPAR